MRGITADDFTEMLARLVVIADDIVILTRERDEAQAEVARLTAGCESLIDGWRGDWRRSHSYNYVTDLAALLAAASVPAEAHQ